MPRTYIKPLIRGESVSNFATFFSNVLLRLLEFGVVCIRLKGDLGVIVRDEYRLA
jgi:hypothetical protein